MWKTQKLALLPKPGTPPGNPASYRPICLIDAVGKLLERIILNRLTKCMEGAVLESAEKASKQKRRGDRYCVVVTIDVKNAFNSASFEAIAAALHRIRIPGYLCHILKHGEVNFHLTQFLSSHGCFRKYLHRFGHVNSPFCPNCENVEETPEHVVFVCPRFEALRREITGLSLENVVEEMCREESTWNAVDRVVSRISSVLQKKWRNDQRESVPGEILLSGNSPSV
ncbi:uncharacterized protein LOC134206674 [Armigeres subalbatus]|uniref:uncharacterized protein LOC134206674 n=1 Tax=Armigeres subalbatus TaxID=124917 RepID=UPI002ED53A9E